MHCDRCDRPFRVTEEGGVRARVRHLEFRGLDGDGQRQYVSRDVRVTLCGDCAPSELHDFAAEFADSRPPPEGSVIEDVTL